MKIIINGESRKFESTPLRLEVVLRAYGFDLQSKGIALALNENLLVRSQWVETELQEGDHLEIVHARQGG